MVVDNTKYRKKRVNLANYRSGSIETDRQKAFYEMTKSSYVKEYLGNFVNCTFSCLISNFMYSNKNHKNGHILWFLNQIPMAFDI